MINKNILKSTQAVVWQLYLHIFAKHSQMMFTLCVIYCKPGCMLNKCAIPNASSNHPYDPFNLRFLYRNSNFVSLSYNLSRTDPDSKVHGANIGPNWGRHEPCDLGIVSNPAIMYRTLHKNERQDWDCSQAKLPSNRNCDDKRVRAMGLRWQTRKSNGFLYGEEKVATVSLSPPDRGDQSVCQSNTDQPGQLNKK